MFLQVDRIQNKLILLIIEVINFLRDVLFVKNVNRISNFVKLLDNIINLFDLTTNSILVNFIYFIGKF